MPKMPVLSGKTVSAVMPVFAGKSAPQMPVFTSKSNPSIPANNTVVETGVTAGFSGVEGGFEVEKEVEAVEKKRTFASMNFSSKSKTTKENTWIANQKDEESSKVILHLYVFMYTEICTYI
jgi:hypothetical protein